MQSIHTPCKTELFHTSALTQDNTALKCQSHKFSYSYRYIFFKEKNITNGNYYNKKTHQIIL